MNERGREVGYEVERRRVKLSTHAMSSGIEVIKCTLNDYLKVIMRYQLAFQFLRAKETSEGNPPMGYRYSGTTLADRWRILEWNNARSGGSVCDGRRHWWLVSAFGEDSYSWFFLVGCGV